VAILGTVELIYGIGQLCAPKGPVQGVFKLYDDYNKLISVAHVIDSILGVALVVLGVLALMHILPLPTEMIQPFGWCAVAGGGVNLFVTLGKSCATIISRLPGAPEHVPVDDEGE
jgi:hypothetical protein